MAEGKVLSDCYYVSFVIWHKCWAIKRHYAQKISLAEMRMLRWMCGNTRRDKVRNEGIHTKIVVAPIEEKMRESVYDGLVKCDVNL